MTMNHLSQENSVVWIASNQWAFESPVKQHKYLLAFKHFWLQHLDQLVSCLFCLAVLNIKPNNQKHCCLTIKVA